MSAVPTHGLPRRRFLQTLGIAVGASAWRPVPVGAAPATGERPRLRFVQINDLHVQAPDVPEAMRTRYLRVNDKARWVLEEINREPRPDFVLGIGDLIHGMVLEQLPKDMTVFREIASALRVPFYPGMGNHEVVQRQGDPRYEKAYRDVYGDDRVNYSFEAGGLLFIMLNNSGASGIPSAVARVRNDWLREVLQANRRQPKILCCHIPLVPVREESVLAKSFGFSTYIAHDAAVLALVDEHADSIVAVLSGHLHLTGLVERNRVHHISIAGTASYPSDYARFELFADRLVMQVCQLPEELARATPSIHGSPRHPQDFTDSTHETGQLYQVGRGDERRLTIRLGKGRA
jgi:predicted MPP superfamily phosphohydrolase